MYDPFFDLKNVHAESIIPLFGSINCHVEWHDPFFESKNGHAKWQERISGKMFLENVFEVLISRDIFLCCKMKALRTCGKIRSAKREKSI